MREKKNMIEELKLELSDISENDYMKNIVHYAEKIILIEQTIKTMKNKHDEDLA